MTEKEKVLNYLRFGDRGDAVWMDENYRCVRRVSGDHTTMPECELFENWDAETETGKFIGTTLVQDAVHFLYGEKYELI